MARAGDHEQADTGRTSELAARVGPMWSTAKVAAELTLDEAALRKLAASGELLALPTSDGPLVFPTAQFERAGDAVRVKPPIRELLKVLCGHDPWAVALVLATVAPEFGCSFYDAARAGFEQEVLVNVARAIDREWRA